MERGGKWAGEGAGLQGRGGGNEDDVEGGADYPMELEGSWCSATSGEMFLDVHREHWRVCVSTVCCPFLPLPGISFSS